MTDEPTNLADHAAKKGNPWFGLGNLLSEKEGVAMTPEMQVTITDESDGQSTHLAGPLPYPNKKHDGKLPGGDTYEVYYDGADKDAYVCIQGTHNLSNYEVILEPKQALSLLSWLEQEKPTLEKMVGVEKDTPKG